MGQKMENQKSKGKFFARAKVMAMSLAICMSLTACSTTSEPNYSGEVSDPFEELNRKTFAFNEALDKAVFNPVVKGYRTVVPQPARTGVRNFVRNLNSPIIVGNQILQGDVEGAAGGVTRFAVNTVFGVGGLIDVAADAGLPYEKEDRHIYNQFVIIVPEKRDALRDFLTSRNVGCEIYYPVPLHLQVCFVDLGYQAGDFPVSEHAAAHSLALPVYPELSDDQMRYVVDQIREFFQDKLR